MKIKSLLIGMLASAALVGCTNENEPVANNQQEGKAEAYMKVKLIMADGAGSRATTDGGYAKGEANEQAIVAANSLFLFYDKDGKWVTDGQLIDETKFSDGDTGNHGHTGTTDINSIYDDAYVVLSSPTGAIKKITQVLTVVNYSKVSTLKLKDLDEALAVIANDPANEGFLMSTSVYVEGGQIKNTTAITSDVDDPTANIQPTKEGAVDNPVKIYIERASAKVQLTYGQTATVITKSEEFEVESVEGDENFEGNEAGGQTGNDIVIDGVQYPAFISIDGWTVNNVNEDTYVVKDVDDAWITTSPFADWSNPADHRSYWAKGTKYDAVAVKGNGLKAYTYNDAVNVLKNDGLTNNAMYCYEQTVESPVAKPNIQYPNVTTVLIAATVKIQKPAAEKPEKVGDIFYYGGVFYTEENYKNLILKQIQDKGYKKVIPATETTAEGTSDLEAKDLTIASDNTLAGVNFTVSTENTYKLEDKEVEASVIKEFINNLDYVKEIEGFSEGKCYYQIPIEHLTSTDGDPLYGVVRNHWYKLNIDKVIRIGSAVYNPEIEIPQIPDKETNYYMAAELHVLNWHVVNQGVTLD